MLNEKQYPGKVISLVDLFLKEQAQTAVERFSGLHDLNLFSNRPFYKDLIPLENPRPGQQFAFEVDLDKCTGCKACVTACHNLNGLDTGETWRSVGLIHDSRAVPPPKPRFPRITFTEFEQPSLPELIIPLKSQPAPLQMNVTTACHHCVEPGCLAGCPVKAYEKDPRTGIVKHLDDQCIGCKYCILMCPYEAPQYNAKQGIVRKCDMCSSRLAAGEAPACVQSCPTQAIRITLVETAGVRQNPAHYIDIPGAPDSQFTLPTTRFKTGRDLPATMQAADHHAIKAGAPEYPLMFMLVLMQLAVGAFLFEFILEGLFQFGLVDAFAPFLTLAAFISGATGLAVAQLHLGRPLYAFRAFLGLKTSWLSREAMAGLAFMGLAALYTALHWFAPGQSFIPLDAVETTTGLLLMVSAGLFVASSAMVYRATPRPLWRSQRTTLKFFSTAIILGASTFLFSAAVSGLNVAHLMRDFGSVVAGLLMAASAVKLVIAYRFLAHLKDKELTSLKKSAWLMQNVFGSVTHISLVSGLMGGVLLPIALIVNTSTVGAVVIATLCFILTLTAEFSERYLFFTCAVSPKMPGAPTGKR
jgi:Fe-S-cluster-containing dehydrogenase component/DMSO reductase anchor subunit